MKFIIILFCTFVLASSQTEPKIDPNLFIKRGKFADLFGSLLGAINNDHFFFTRDEVSEINSKLLCLQNKVGFEQNKDKMVEGFTFPFLFVGACGLCIGNQDKFWAEQVDKLLGIVKEEKTFVVGNIECLELEFRKYQPSSTLLRNFDDAMAHSAASICAGNDDVNEIKDFIKKAEMPLGGFAELTCGAVNDRVLLELVLNIFLMGNEKDEAVVDAEVKRLANELKKYDIRMVDCMKQKINFD